MNLNRSYKIVLAALFVVNNFLAVAQTTNALAPAEYPKFIATRNIFDPARVPNVPWTPARTRPAYVRPVVNQMDSFSLVGIIGYGEGRLAGVYAFFDGTSPDYRKTVRLNDSIANFKITGISVDSVTLMLDTNGTTVLRIGEQLHNDGVGHWLSANGIAAQYSKAGGYGRIGRNGYGNAGRRNNNFGNGNYNSGGNNYAASAAAPDNSQTSGQNMNSQNDSTAPGGNAAPDDNTTPPDGNANPEPAQQNN